LLAVGLLLAASAPASASVYFGALIGGEPYGQVGDAPENEAAWDLFERHAGKKVAILNEDQPWCSFDQAAMDKTAARGAIPLVTMGLVGATLAEVREGKQDAAIKKWAQAAKAWGHPFLFGPWWEMNGAWFAWGRNPEFVAAWRHFHDVVVAQGATNVTWTWITNAIWSDPESDPTPYYPGNEYVDWVGIDSYNWGLNPAQPEKWRNPDQTVTPTLSIVNKLTGGKKPVAIVEEASSEYGGNKADWIREMLTTYVPHHPEIQAYLWFNRNTERNEAHKDWMIETSVTAQQSFRRAIQSGIYVSAPVGLPNLTKVPPPSAGTPDPVQAADLSEPAEIATGPDVAVAPDGTATVVWSARTNGKFAVYMRRIAADGSREPAVQLSDPTQDALAPQVAVDPDGTATVVWSRFDGSNFVVQGRRVDPEGTPESSTKNLSKTGRDAADPRLAVAPDGTTTVVWKRFDGFHDRVEERRITPEGERLPAESTNLLSAEKQDAVEPEVASAPDGTSTVVWSRFDGSDSIVQERRIDPQGAIEGEAADLSAPEEGAKQPEVAVAPDGEATVVWTRFDASNWLIQGQRLDPEGAPDGAVANLSAGGRDAAEPQLAIDAEGRATVVWERYDGSSFVVQARRLNSAGVPASVQNLSAGGRDAAEPQLATDPDGTATVVWSRFDGSNFVVQRRDVAADGTLATTEGVSAPGRRASAPTVAWGSDGTLAMVWRRFAGSGDVVQTESVPPPPPPPPPGGEEPGTGGGTHSTGSTPSRGGSAIAPSFQIAKVIINRKHGTATLKVSVSGPGQLSLAGAVPRSQTLDGAGVASLRVVPKAAKRRLLSRRGALRLKVTVSFEPLGGSAISQRLTLGLRKSQPKTG
jgi:phage terminase large subunit-like protein